MSDYRSEFRDSIVSYLEREFPDFNINEEASDDSYCFRLLKENRTHFLRVMFDAIQVDDSNHVTEMLEQFAPAHTMRGLGDFPVVVTEQGCMFGSP